MARARFEQLKQLMQGVPAAEFPPRPKGKSRERGCAVFSSWKSLVVMRPPREISDGMFFRCQCRKKPRLGSLGLTDHQTEECRSTSLADAALLVGPVRDFGDFFLDNPFDDRRQVLVEPRFEHRTEQFLDQVFERASGVA